MGIRNVFLVRCPLQITWSEDGLAKTWPEIIGEAWSRYIDQQQIDLDRLLVMRGPERVMESFSYLFLVSPYRGEAIVPSNVHVQDAHWGGLGHGDYRLLPEQVRELENDHTELQNIGQSWLETLLRKNSLRQTRESRIEETCGAFRRLIDRANTEERETVFVFTSPDRIGSLLATIAYGWRLKDGYRQAPGGDGHGIHLTLIDGRVEKITILTTTRKSEGSLVFIPRNLPFQK